MDIDIKPLMNRACQIENGISAQCRESRKIARRSRLLLGWLSIKRAKEVASRTAALQALAAEQTRRSTYTDLRITKN